ncbi:MAG: PAS domain-containing sensor histidine kinase [Rhodothermaceae bacterium]
MSKSLNIKILLVLMGSIISIGSLIYTQNLVEKLQTKEKKLVELYTKSYEYLIGTEGASSEFNFILENVIQKIEFPLIVTDVHDHVTLDGTYKNIDIDSTLSTTEKRKVLLESFNELKATNPPLLVTITINGEKNIISKIYYGDSDLVKQIRYFPYFQILFALFFILIAYLSFSHIRKSEQSNIWVGMSKETAHQLGTPISSLMGWYEYLKLSHKDPTKVLNVAEEINTDLTRLNKVAQRFSKIGSQPKLKEENLFSIIQKVIIYFQKRLPHLEKDVKIHIKGNSNIHANINADLFEWVLENLTKNALDAIEHKQGEVCFSLEENNKNVILEVRDNGKGIEAKKKADVFKPGYSTKKRGWGLGLSLAKRIIDEYHKGKISIKSSHPGKGTTFQILFHKD